MDRRSIDGLVVVEKVCVEECARRIVRENPRASSTYSHQPKHVARSSRRSFESVEASESVLASSSGGCDPVHRIEAKENVLHVR